MSDSGFIPTRQFRGRFKVSLGSYDVQPSRREIPANTLIWLSHSKCAIDPDIERAFISYQAALLDETAGTSRFRDIMLNQNYRWMIALGDLLIPILLREVLVDRSPTWLNLLRDVARLDPVPPEDRNDYTRAVARWREWGLEEGYLIDNGNSIDQPTTSVEAFSTLN